jgi:hypothetical protein
VETRAGQLDALAWVALQTGSWGNLNQRAGAFAAEAGWQPRILAWLKPWFRAGYDYGSGDKNAGDSTHGTFFQVLPTPRIYARFPFFNMMNNRVCCRLLLRTHPGTRPSRSDVHSLSLASRNESSSVFPRGRLRLDIQLSPDAPPAHNPGAATPHMI